MTGIASHHSGNWKGQYQGFFLLVVVGGWWLVAARLASMYRIAPATRFVRLLPGARTACNCNWPGGGMEEGFQWTGWNLDQPPPPRLVLVGTGCPTRHQAPGHQIRPDWVASMLG